jgi:hypothetical protein
VADADHYETTKSLALVGIEVTTSTIMQYAIVLQLGNSPLVRKTVMNSLLLPALKVLDGVSELIGISTGRFDRSLNVTNNEDRWRGFQGPLSPQLAGDT